MNGIGVSQLTSEVVLGRYKPLEIERRCFGQRQRVGLLPLLVGGLRGGSRWRIAIIWQSSNLIANLAYVPPYSELRMSATVH